MNIFRTSISILFLLTVTTTVGQKNTPRQKNIFASVHLPDSDKELKRNCFTTQMEEKLQQKYPNRLTEQGFEDRMKQLIEGRKNARTTSDEQLYQIPTIVHVVHNGEAIGTDANISNAQVMSQFDVLNEDFRRVGAGYNEHPSGADILIEFIPVRYDPEGNTLDEPGIHRYDGSRDSWDEAAVETHLKPTTIWDPERFFNIWVVQFGGDLDDVLGYAQFPSMSGLDGLGQDEGPASTDGVIIGYQFFGNTGNVVAPYDGGRTTTHEVGHWLGLRHIWGDGGCDVDDYCADTPNAGEPNFTCSTVDSCPGDGLNDMIENYMDYTNDACMNIFTLDQKARIRTVLDVSPRRSTLRTAGCADAGSIAAGEQTATPSSWHTYTASSNTIVTVSSVGTTNQNTHLGLFTSCDVEPIVFVDDVYGTIQSEFSTYMQSGESLYILWDGRHSSEEFTWTLAESSAVDGGACGLANSAQSGTNNVSATSLKTVWYSYTMLDTQSKIELNMSGTPTNVYKGSCNQLTKLGETDGSFLITDVGQGDQIFLAIESDGNAFDFTLSISELLDGESCSTAVAISDGDYTAPSTLYWYDYTSTGYGLIYLTSEQRGKVKVYDQCNGDLLGSANIENDTLWIVTENQQNFKFKWEFEAGATPYDWSIGFQLFEAGDVCEVALLVETDTIEAPYAPIWYYYTVPRDGTVEISSLGLTDNDTYLAVFDDCNQEALIGLNDDYGEDILQSHIVLPLMQQGDVLRILWLGEYSTDPFKWRIEIRDDIEGESCLLPATATNGMNSTDPADAQLLWYTFEPTESNKKIVITSTSNNNVYVLLNDCEDIKVLTFGEGEAFVTDYTPGVSFLIVWEMVDEASFDWEISYEEVQMGESCSSAFVLELPGLISGTLPPRWYSYTMPKDGDLKISSVGKTNEDTYLEVYSGCDLIAEYVGESDDATGFQSEFIVEGLQAGDQILIKWLNIYSDAAFNWELSVLNSVNVAPVVDNFQFMVNSSNEIGDVIGVISAIDDDDDDLLFYFKTGSNDFFDLDPYTGELTLKELEGLSDQPQQFSIFIVVSDRIDYDESLITIVNNVLGLEDIKPTIYPNPSSGILHIDDSKSPHLGGWMRDLSGKVVGHLIPGDPRMDVSHLQPGVYLLQLEFSGGTTEHKIIIE